MNLADIKQLVLNAAQRHHLDPSWFHAMMGAESGFNPNAVSRAGAQGLGQLMPGTAAGLGVKNPFDPAQSAEGSASYMAQLLRQFGNSYPQATAAYNMGPGAMQRIGGNLARIPEQTKAYLAKVTAQAGHPVNPTPTPTTTPAATPQAAETTPQAAPAQPNASMAPVPGQDSGTLANLLANVARAVPGAPVQPHKPQAQPGLFGGLIT